MIRRMGRIDPKSAAAMFGAAAMLASCAISPPLEPARIEAEPWTAEDSPTVAAAEAASEGGAE